jgi:hypothetical protein
VNWIIWPLLYGFGGFVTLTAAMIVNFIDSGRVFNMQNDQEWHAAIFVFVFWPLVMLFLFAVGTAYGVVRSARALAIWLQDAVK